MIAKGGIVSQADMAQAAAERSWQGWTQPHILCAGPKCSLDSLESTWSPQIWPPTSFWRDFRRTTSGEGLIGGPSQERAAILPEIPKNSCKGTLLEEEVPSMLGA
ncbi:hypothetical protein WJX84_011064 [Apatococcus fuscideae]|uniref:Uncharacterized protein n=1 Tax=Apatococcus fuscideae TaxID=2026836 RepID=A0AAW1T3K0_9CHLO